MNKSFSLYIHIPFCKKKCYYCDFYSLPLQLTTVPEIYLDAFQNEIAGFLGKYNLSVNLEIKTIYFGGGTPSVLTSEQIKRLFRIIAQYFDLSSVEEVTFEVNPESFSKEKLEMLLLCCENFKEDVLRISVGVQSFNDEILSSAGRIHCAEDGRRVLSMLLSYGIKNYNVDFIYGFESQSLEDVEKDIKDVLCFNPKHISCYALTISEGSLLYEKGHKLDEFIQSLMYEMIVENLIKKGYKRYEISNFALPGYESKHNLNYWQYGEYLGFGSSAVSFFDNKRVKNISTLEKYLEGNFNYEIENISEEQKIKEKIMLGLRTSYGVPIRDIIEKKYLDVLKKSLEKNFLVLEDDRVKINDKYWFTSNSIISEFF